MNSSHKSFIFRGTLSRNVFWPVILFWAVFATADSARANMPGPCPDSWTKIANTALAPNAVTFTALTGNKNGAAWNPVQIDLHSPFDMSCSLLVQVDGVAFVLQSEGLTAIGGWGAGQGYGNVYGTTPGTPVAPSVDFEVDTFDNYGPDVNDPSYDHLSVKLNGVMSVYAAGPVYAIPGQSDISDGKLHTFRVTWDPTTTLFNIYFDGSLRLTYTADVINQVFSGHNMVYWGFTGSSSYYNQYIILPCGSSSTPTPSPTPTTTYTPTPTFTPTDTYTPISTSTSTDTPMPTSTPTVTDTFTSSNTPTPSFTPTPSCTPTSTATSTDTPTSTYTSTWTSTATNTLTFTATPDIAFHVWPNPFNPSEAVRGTLKVSYIPEGGRLSIYTLSGEKVIVLQATSTNYIEWDGTTPKGVRVSPGVYYYLLLVQGKCASKNTLLIQ